MQPSPSPTAEYRKLRFEISALRIGERRELEKRVAFFTRLFSRSLYAAASHSSREIEDVLCLILF